MTVTFFAENNEFAAATGSNVNYSPNVSRFDYPPSSSRNLTITSQAGDSDPRLFEVGEVYSVSFTGNGAATITNATVIRSDYTTADDGTPVEGNEGAIVFEGLDENGDLVQVVWSPNFDLQTWYFDNFSGSGQSPGFYTQDTNSAQTARFNCYARGTMIAVPGGHAPVEALRAGDDVLTRDHGVVPLLWCAHSMVPGLGRGAPITVAPDVLGGNAPLIMSPQHRLLVQHPMFEAYFRSAEVLVAAKHLVDGIRVTRTAWSEVSYHHLLCERHEVLDANGVAAESLLLGDTLDGVMSDAARSGFERDARCRWEDLRHRETARPVLRRDEAILARVALGLELRDTTQPVPAMFFAA